MTRSAGWRAGEARSLLRSSRRGRLRRRASPSARSPSTAWGLRCRLRREPADRSGRVPRSRSMTEPRQEIGRRGSHPAPAPQSRCRSTMSMLRSTSSTMTGRKPELPWPLVAGGRAAWLGQRGWSRPRPAVRPASCSSRWKNIARPWRSHTACPCREKAASDLCRPAAWRWGSRPLAANRRWAAAHPRRRPRKPRA